MMKKENFTPKTISYNTKTRKRPMSPTKDNPESVFTKTFTVLPTITELEVPFEYDANVQIMETTNVDTYQVFIDNVLVSDNFTTFYVSKGQILKIVTVPLDAAAIHTITLEIKFI